MKEKRHIKKLGSLLPVFGLALLLLLSPCKVRNFIQSHFDVTQSETLNKSQSTINTSGCETLEVSEALQTSLTKTIKNYKFQIPEVYRFEIFSQSKNLPFSFNPPETQRGSNIPLYILYQSLTVYS